MEQNKLLVAVIALFAGACSGTVQQPAASHAVTTSCAGGTIRSDAELAELAGCQTVVGDLQVQGVTTLDSLHDLRHVTGTLTVGPTRALYELSGLEQLRSVGALVLERNEGLLNASLSTLTDARRVRITYNPRLSKSQGFVDGVSRTSCQFELSHNLGLRAEGVEQVSRPSSDALLGRL